MDARSEKEFETGLGAMRSELETMDGKLKEMEEKAKDLKDFVRQYNQIRQEQADLKKKRKAVLTSLMTISEFFQRVTGHFPDGMYPLFNQGEPAETKPAA